MDNLQLNNGLTQSNFRYITYKNTTPWKNLTLHGERFNFDLGPYEARKLPNCSLFSVFSACFFHIRQLRLVRRSLNEDATHALVRALVHSRLDYCNGVLTGMSIDQLRRLQSVLKASARLVLRLPVKSCQRVRSHDQQVALARFSTKNYI